MKKIIFWYGSLLSAEWWNRTLERKVTNNDLIYLELKWFKRVWSYTNPIIFINEQNKIYWGVFLDIIEDNDSIINWYWVELSDKEFNLIERREKWYKMLDITDFIVNKDNSYKYFTSYLINKNIKNNYNKVIPKKYYDFVEDILKKQSNKFIDMYRELTEKINYILKDGEYKFLDNDINKATWRI